MVRTDRYASREWTQREVLAAKRHDVPIVGLIALTEGEARGSFLMDHVPTVALRDDAVTASIAASLNRLVDEVLKRALWGAQSTYIRDEGFDLDTRACAGAIHRGRLAFQAPIGPFR